MSKDPWQEPQQPEVVVVPTCRRRLTNDECGLLGYPPGTEAQCDEAGHVEGLGLEDLVWRWRAAQEPQSAFEATGDAHYLQQQGPGQITVCPDYSGRHLRLQCLSMALGVPDGAQPPPLDEVVERAVRYWHFISSGE